MIKETIDNIIKNKSRVVVLSPHFDDAIFSMGGLLNELKNKAEITVVNIFTKQSKPYTISAKKFLSQCGYKDLEKLYKDREIEDNKALTLVGAKIINLDFEDALFRKIEKPNLVQKLLGKKLAEFLHIYPTYKFNISKGMVFKNDRANIDKLISIIKDLKLTKNDYLFAPMGIGKHVDHRIANIVGQKMNNETNTIFYADYPYVVNSKTNKNNFMSFKPNWKTKEKLMRDYKSQFNAIFAGKIKKSEELYKEDFDKMVSKHANKEIHGANTKLKVITPIIFILFILLFVRGNTNPTFYNLHLDTTIGGPFETSNSTARYALTMSILRNHSLTFTKDLAKFSAPDVSSYNGKYFSTFLPLISFLGVPFYYIGEKIGLTQLSTYLLNIIAGILDVLLIIKISKKLGSNYWASIISGVTFLFATNALNYSLGFTQHNISTAILLMMFSNFLESRNVITNLIFGALIGLGILADIPNPILALPIIVVIAFKSFEKIDSVKNKTKIIFKLNNFGYLIGIIPMLGILLWYNMATTGSFTKLAQTIGRTHEFAVDQPIQDTVEDSSNLPGGMVNKKFSLPFETRIQLSGINTLVTSNERSWLFYSPVILFGIIGFIYLLKDQEKKIYGQILIAIVLINIILYSMFGDPWGGWAFGPRYLIPAASILCIGLSVWLTKNKNIFAYILFGILLVYSIFVNVLGALTTSAVPPKVEAIHLNSPIPYTYQYNWELVNNGMNSSLVYNVFFKNKITPIVYFYLVFGLVTLMFTILNILYIKNEKSKT